MTIKNSLNNLYQNIKELEKQYRRSSDSVKLLAVSKKQSIEKIYEAWTCGQKAFGENYLQEALSKIEALESTDIEWHFIGPIQANKTRRIAENFAWVHSIDRENIAERLNHQRPNELPPLNVCIQVNIDYETTKSGVEPENILPLAQYIQSLPRLILRGLMIIPEIATEFEQQREPFRQLKEILVSLNKKLTYPLDTLSMGMSEDYPAAIAEGATIIRVGTGVFGKRE